MRVGSAASPMDNDVRDKANTWKISQKARRELRKMPSEHRLDVNSCVGSINQLVLGECYQSRFPCIMNAANTLRANVPSFSARPLTSLPSLTNLTSCLRALWVPEISQPSSAVEFGIGSLDLAFAVDVEDIDALDLLLVIAGAVDGDPAPSDLVAAVQDVQALEIERGLFG
jgi:hypothetical protein